MSELAQALGSLEPSKGDMVSRLELSEVERTALDDALISGYFTDVEISRILYFHGHTVTANAVTYYRKKLLRERGLGE